MKPAAETLCRNLREARTALGLRQSDLSRLTGVPQAQISRIEANSVDPRTSSLLQLAHGLGLELVLVPLHYLPAVQSILRQTAKIKSAYHDDREPQPAYQLGEDDE